jgi:hypothetical protein
VDVAGMFVCQTMCVEVMYELPMLYLHGCDERCRIEAGIVEQALRSSRHTLLLVSCCSICTAGELSNSL